MADYKKLIDEARRVPTSAALATVRPTVKPKRLTTRRPSASLSVSARKRLSRRRTSSPREKATVPRKAKRRGKLSKAERRKIALRNLAKAHRGRHFKRPGGHYKVKRKGLVKGKRGWRKKTVYTVSEAARRSRKRHRKSPKRVAAGRKAARTRKRRRNPILAETPRRRRRRKNVVAETPKRRRRRAKRNPWPKGKSRSRSNAARKGWRKRKHGRSSAKRHKTSHRRRASGHRKSPKRVAAGRKAARTRAKRRHRTGYQRKTGSAFRSEKQRQHELTAYAYEGRRRRRHRRRNPFPLPNPTSHPMEFLTELFGFGAGFLWQDGIDRYAATHALATDTGGNVTDSPAAGQIYNSESLALPIWSSWQRMAFNAAGIAVPFFLARYFAKDFMMKAGMAAVIRTVGKAATDAVATYVPQNAMTLRLYGDEVASAARLAQTAGTAPSTAPAGTFAGVPRRQLAAPQKTRRVGDSGADDFCTQSSVMSDPLAASQAVVNPPPGAMDPGGCGTCYDNYSGFNPLTAGTTPENNYVPTIQVTPSPTTGGSGGGGGGYVPTAPSGGGGGSGSGNGNCSAIAISTMQGILVGAQKQINNPFDGTDPNVQQYEGTYNQLLACGVTPNTPSLATLQGYYNTAQQQAGQAFNKAASTAGPSTPTMSVPR
jgi:hypothetical protein